MTHIERYHATIQNYPMLARASEVLSAPPATIVGRDPHELMKGLRNPEKANIALLGEPGTGKTAAVQGFAYHPDSLKHYLVLEVNPEKLMGQGEDKDSSMLIGFRQLVEEAGNYSKEHNVIMVLFVDEFHKIPMFSPSLVESLKPMLEKSALNNFRIIASTTFEEYNRWIASKNRALDQRFLRITLPELPKEVILKILEGRAKQHGAIEMLAPGILEDVYNESKRILLSNAQPRASIDILLSMIGETVKFEYMKNGALCREFYTPSELDLPSDYNLSRPLLKKVIQRTHGIDIDNAVDVKDVVGALKTRLFNQDQAIDTIVSYLEMAANGFSDTDRPKISFLSTGSTGVGKTELAKIIADTMRIPLKRFDMSRYSNEKDAGRFGDDLFAAVWSTPNAYLLIDEVEKSSRQAMNILLQVLDDARLTDTKNPDRVASFSGAIINLTTNLASEVYQNMHKHQGSDARVPIELVYKALASDEVFETALLGRIDVIVPFRPLPNEALTKIATRTLADAIDIAETRLRRIVISDDVIPYIVKDRTSSDTERGGARDTKRNVKNLVVQALAHYMTYATREVPVMVYLKGRPRFKYSEIADPMNAQIAIKECYAIQDADKFVAHVGQHMGRPLQNKGLYLPNDVPPKIYVAQIAKLAQAGYSKFESYIDDERVHIRGVE